MSICTTCAFRIEDRMWCLHFSNWIEFSEHAKKVLSENSCSLCREENKINA